MHATALLLLVLLTGNAFAHGDLHEQIADVTRQIEAAPAGSNRLAALYFQRGELHRKHGAWAEAEADYSAAERLDTDRELRDLELSRGRMYLDSNRPAEANTALEQYLAHQGSHPDALLIQARALIALGQGIEAAEHLDKAIARHPQPEPDHFLMRADTLEKLGKKHFARAIRGLDEGIRRLGPIVTLETRALDLELALSRWNAALARVDVLLARQTRRDIWLARRADILEQAGRARQARRARRAALAAIEQLPPTIRAQKTTAELHGRLVRALSH